MSELRKRVTDAHIDFIDTYLQNMTCPTSQKLELIDAVKDSIESITNEAVSD